MPSSKLRPVALVEQAVRILRAACSFKNGSAGGCRGVFPTAEGAEGSVRKHLCPAPVRQSVLPRSGVFFAVFHALGKAALSYARKIPPAVSEGHVFSRFPSRSRRKMSRGPSCGGRKRFPHHTRASPFRERRVGLRYMRQGMCFFRSLFRPLAEKG